LGIGATRHAPSSPPVSMDHAHDFDSFSFTVDEPLDGERLQALFDSLPKSLLRAKGVLNLVEEPGRRTVYQRVGERRSYAPAEPWGDETSRSSIVFIGPAGWLDRSKLEAGLDACRADRNDARPPKTLQHKER
jgi:G3E family GTPase